MLVDGITLVAGSGLGVRLLDDARRGLELPIGQQSNGDLFELTHNSGENISGVYEYQNNRWSLRTPHYSLLSYDISGSVYDKPVPDAKVLYFVAPRAFHLLGGFAGAIAKAEVEAQLGQAFYVTVDTGADFIPVGTMYFAAGSTEGQFTSTFDQDILIRRGDILIVTTDASADSQISNISFTLCGYLSA